MEPPSTWTRSLSLIRRRDKADGVKRVHGDMTGHWRARMQASPLCVTTVAMAASLTTLLLLAGSAYAFCATMDSDLRFLSPLREPTIDEALISCPVEYAIHSTEDNDVIFLGGSSCRCGIDPKLLSGPKSYNLGSTAGLQSSGLLVTAKSYFLHHRAPKVVMLCLSPIAFDFGLDDGWTNQVTQPFLANYGAESGAAITEVGPYFIRRGLVGLLHPGQGDPRDLPLAGMPSDTYRSFKAKASEGRGYVGLRGEHAQSIDMKDGGPPLQAMADWGSFVHRLAHLCAGSGARLIVRFTPISAEKFRSRDFSGLDDWARQLESPADNIAIAQPIVLVYPASCMWDHVHLNRAGVEKFMPLVAKDVQAVLGR